jgi:hypothetical protein
MSEGMILIHAITASPAMAAPAPIAILIPRVRGDFLAFVAVEAAAVGLALDVDADVELVPVDVVVERVLELSDVVDADVDAVVVEDVLSLLVAEECFVLDALVEAVFLVVAELAMEELATEGLGLETPNCVESFPMISCLPKTRRRDIHIEKSRRYHQ